MGKIDGSRKNRKKLSWTYKKKKQQKKKRADNNDTNVQVQNKKARIIVRNLSFKVTEDDLRNLYASFGQIEQIDLLRRPDGKPVGCGFVQFKQIEDASKAIFKTNKQEFLERSINVSWAIPKSKFVEKLNSNFLDKSKDEPLSSTEEKDITQIDHDHPDSSQPKGLPNECKSSTMNNRNLKLQKRQKRSRIIIRNLPFKITEDDLKKYFSQYGTIEEVKLLTKQDGKRVGCGFIQYENVQSAAKAIHYSNLKPMMDRLIVVDWAVPKKVFQQESKIEAKCEKSEDVALHDECEAMKPIIEGLNEEAIENGQTTEEEEEEEFEDNEWKREDVDINSEKSVGNEIEKCSRVIKNDVNEGKTIFLKNIPFSIKNEELKSCMEQFGPVYYALVCVDPLTEHSKGTAFVKFRNLEDADKCLSAGTELKIGGEILDPHRAISKKDVLDLKSVRSNHAKDSRNLYLVKEGVILAGSPAAVDVSNVDMKKRLEIEQWKSQMLRNLSMFVSRVRVVIHNLPATLDDAKLRAIFKKHAGEKAVITEAKVMRNLKNPDANGVGKSKEFGFVAFTRHEDALKALRHINNNPNIFSKEKRPIVSFSIENRVMVNAKKRRAQKSRDNNPLSKGKSCTDSKQVHVDGPTVKRAKEFEDINDRKIGTSASSKGAFKTAENEMLPEFSGITSRSGDRKMRSKLNLRTQAQLHAEVQKSQKKERKIKRKLIEQNAIERTSRKEIKSKHGTKKLNRDEIMFHKMVEDYRSKLSAVSSIKTKWYESSN